jgi:arabinogalactan oligomer / maltooligosaccharide transport system permease protein
VSDDVRAGAEGSRDPRAGAPSSRPGQELAGPDLLASPVPPPTPPTPPRGPRRLLSPEALRDFSLGSLIWKVVFLGAVNGFAIYGLAIMWSAQAWFGLAATILATIAINWIYLAKRAMPLRFLIPGTLFLLVFQVYPVLYTSYIAFTNYGTAFNLTKEQAIDRIQANNLLPTETGVPYDAIPATDGEVLALILIDPDGAVFLGTEDGLAALGEGDVVRDNGRIVAADGFRRLSVREAQDQQAALTAIVIPVEDGGIRLKTFTTATVREARIVYDAETDTMTDLRDGTVYHAEDGAFRSDDGSRLAPGFRAVVGLRNFERVLTSPAIRGPFLRVFVWTFVFAGMSVLLTFVMGVLLAMALNHPLMKFKRLYRSLLIFPYALPSFMTALIWAGLLNQRFGAVNRVLGTNIDWLGNPTTAKMSTLLVNLWLGFPYMFLVSTGALQSIPNEMKEAAFMDGASAWQAFRRVTLPLLLIPLSPLLIASFAFNFNNFNVIYLLTRGGPPMIGAGTPAGHTDILISYTYRLAFATGHGQDYGLAAAVSVMIFLIVAIVTMFSFYKTRTFEEIS